MLINKKYNLTYCSNIFKQKKWKFLFENLKKYLLHIKRKKQYIGISLCMSNVLLNEIRKDKTLSILKNWLITENVYISSMNGFVYKTFHQKKIKDNIYYPDWTTKQRIKYTKSLIELLGLLMHKNTMGSISTVPISYLPWIKTRHISYILFTASKNLSEIIKFLIEKKNIHLDLEPEPDCLINSIDSFIKFYIYWLIPVTKIAFNTKSNFLEPYIKKYIRLCYDICHFSVNFESHEEALCLLKKNKIKIGKIQVSSALEVKVFNSSIENKHLVKNLLSFTKSPFLHQTVEKIGNKLKKHKDISYAIKNFSEKCGNTLRIHCHAPLYKNIIRGIKTTSVDTKFALELLLKEKYIKEMEIETYTHDFLSKENKFESIFMEYNWVINLINNQKHDNN